MRKLFLLGVMSAAVALAAACSSSTNGSTESDDTCGNCVGPGPDSGSDATTDAGGDAACPVQSLPPNAATCPSTYSATYEGQLCSPAGLQCYYAGAGDIDQNGCSSPGELFCEYRDSGIGEIPDAAIFDDAGDASVGYWTFAQ